MKPKFLATALGALMLAAILGFAQRHPGEQGAHNPGGALPETAETRILAGTVVSFEEKVSMTVKTSDGSGVTFDLLGAAVNPGIRKGAAVRVTESTDSTGKRVMTVEPGPQQNH